jgi:hypothetical protein
MPSLFKKEGGLANLQSAVGGAGRSISHQKIEREVCQLGLSGYHAAAVNIQPEGYSMITQMFKRRFAPESVYPQIIQYIVLLIAAIILVAGFRQMAELELTKAQLLLGIGVVFSLVLQCCMLWVLIELARKMAERGSLSEVEPGTLKTKSL